MGNKVYFFGGVSCDDSNCTAYTDYADLFVYNIQDNSGQLLNSDTAPPPRFYHSAVYCESKNIMVIFGGLSIDILEDLWIHVIDGEYWNEPTVDGTPPSPRYLHSGMTAHIA